MLDKKDARWWILEAQQHPEKAPDLIRLLAERLTALDRQNEELRGELITLRRKQRGETVTAEIGALQSRIEELEDMLRLGGNLGRLLVYRTGVLLANRVLPMEEDLLPPLDERVSMLITKATARLLAITADSRAFSLMYSDLPAPEKKPILLDSPRDVVAFLDQSVFEQRRYLLLLSQNGYAYSILAGAIARSAAKQEKLLRNLVPGDPLVAAIPSQNADLMAVSRQGRWIRFPEKALAGTGTQVMVLPRGDSLAGITGLASETHVFMLSATGVLFARSSVSLPSRSVPGRPAGTLIANQDLLGVFTGGSLALITSGGRLIELSLRDLPARAETEAGMRVPGLEVGENIVAYSAA